MSNAILIRDIQGLKTPSGFGGVVKGLVRDLLHQKDDVHVLRGELLVPQECEDGAQGEDDQKRTPFQLFSDSQITVFCNAQDIAPLNHTEFQLLAGIKSPQARHKVFIDDGLDWGSRLVDGSHVSVALPSSNLSVPTMAVAIVRYVGPFPDELGLKFGVEIMETDYRGKGNTNGFFREKNYFRCEEDCGLFVSLDKIHPIPQAGGQPANAQPHGSAHTSQSPTQSLVTVDQPPAVQVGDRVVLNNKKGVACHGEVKWMGTTVAARKFKYPVVGMVMDDELKDADFEGAIAGMIHLISGSKKTNLLFMPASLVSVDQSKLDPTPQHQSEYPSPAVHSDQPPAFPNVTESDQPTDYQHNQPTNYPPGTQPGPHQDYQPSYHPPAVSQPSAGPSHAHFTVAPPDQACYPDLEIGSVVEVITTTTAPRYGVIKWIGRFPNVNYDIAGIELEEELEGCTDGTWQGTGERFFECPTGRAFFCPLYSLKPDTRFGEPTQPLRPGAAVGGYKNPLDHVPLEIEADQGFGQTRIPSVESYIGDMRGIQGHHNSCYLDATIFGLFALSDVFDSLFLGDSKDDVGESIKRILWRSIVNPLRKIGVVRYESVMALREQLDRLGKMKGIAQDEKDPEEFLNMLFKHTLHVPPFITIQRPQGEEGEFFVQLFMEPFEGLRLPNIETLLRRMFKEQHIKFGQVPSKLLIQVPRYGKQFKAFEKIIPNVRMSIDDLCASSANNTKSIKTTTQSKCFICHAVGRVKCMTCKDDFLSHEVYVYFCEECSEKVHKVPSRVNHVPEQLQEAGVELELLSVLCIETSHYVCFTRFNDRWIFMDSMADRQYDMYNIPKGVDVTRNLEEWVYSGDEKRLKETAVRKLPQYVRRFTQDIYMCVYIQPDFDMYM